MTDKVGEKLIMNVIHQSLKNISKKLEMQGECSKSVTYRPIWSEQTSLSLHLQLHAYNVGRKIAVTRGGKWAKSTK